MSTRLSVTINTGNNKNDGETKRSECQNCADVLVRIAYLLQNTQASGTVTDRNGLVHSYTYTSSSLA
jgi:hypothetical protein